MAGQLGGSRSRDCPYDLSIDSLPVSLRAHLQMFGRTVLYIPPLCKLNPFYDQFVGLRFRAMCYLADVCGEDISCYC
jgi:hypothetical protein